jgi:hypothetical protein
MSDEKEVTGKFRYEQDSKRYHRLRLKRTPAWSALFMCKSQNLTKQIALSV